MSSPPSNKAKLRSRTLALVVLPALSVVAGAEVLAATLAAAAHAHQGHQHEQQRETGGYVRTEVHYRVPELSLIDTSGDAISLVDELNRPEPVMLNFIFTSCAAICPVMSATFSQVRKQLGTGGDDLRMVSISTDPEHDTPQRLRDYARRYHAGPKWQFLTGELAQVITVQKAFDAYRGAKMNHAPLTIMRASPHSPWVRLDGFASVEDLMREYRQLTAP